MHPGIKKSLLMGLPSAALQCEPIFYSRAHLLFYQPSNGGR